MNFVYKHIAMKHGDSAVLAASISFYLSTVWRRPQVRCRLNNQLSSLPSRTCTSICQCCCPVSELAVGRTVQEMQHSNREVSAVVDTWQVQAMPPAAPPVFAGLRYLKQAFL
jgi:hypothetical protein